ncbi:MAG: hypothetical protein U1E56_01050 [Bauldia sp.]
MSRLATLALLLWGLTIGGAAYLFVHGITAKASDGREKVMLTAAEHVHVLGEMRTLLQASADIAGAIARGDNAAVSRAALPVGTAAIATDSPDLLARLPLDLKNGGLKLHQGFDAIAAAAGKGATAPELTRLLSEQLSLCVGCHAVYSFGE